MQKLLASVRYIIVIGSAAFIILSILIAHAIFPNPAVVYNQLGGLFGQATLIFLYLSLLATPLYFVFPHLPFRPLYVKARRALGFSAFMFAAFHGYYEFFKILGGPSIFVYSTAGYNFALEMGMVSFIIIAFMALTSFNTAIKLLGPNWKVLHRFIYIGALTTLLHVLLIGFDSHDSSTASFVAAAAFLLVLEFLRINAWSKKHFQKLPEHLVTAALSILLLIGMTYYFNFFPNTAITHPESHRTEKGGLSSTYNLEYAVLATGILLSGFAIADKRLALKKKSLPIDQTRSGQ